jgi:Transposase DDE domain
MDSSLTNNENPSALVTACAAMNRLHGVDTEIESAPTPLGQNIIQYFPTPIPLFVYCLSSISYTLTRYCNDKGHYDRFYPVSFNHSSRKMVIPKKQRFRLRNWKEYNEALVNRGSITFWFDEEAISTWHPVKTTQKRGRPLLYTAIAIECTLTLREIYHLPLRGTEDLVRSLIRLSDLPLKAPDYTTLCIRQKILKVTLPKYHSKSEKLI